MEKIKNSATAVFWEFVLLPLFGAFMIVLAILAELVLHKWLRASIILCVVTLVSVVIWLTFRNNTMAGVGVSLFLYVFLAVLGERSHENLRRDNIYS